MDWVAALENTGGDRELLMELAAMFVEDFPRFVEDARKALALNDAETLAREAHTMKGRMAFFGLEAIRSQSAALERLCQQARLEDAEKTLEALTRAITEALPEFQALSQG